jgi:hypothetical protein
MRTRGLVFFGPDQDAQIRIGGQRRTGRMNRSPLVTGGRIWLLPRPQSR